MLPTLVSCLVWRALSGFSRLWLGFADQHLRLVQSVCLGHATIEMACELGHLDKGTYYNSLTVWVSQLRCNIQLKLRIFLLMVCSASEATSMVLQPWTLTTAALFENLSFITGPNNWAAHLIPQSPGCKCLCWHLRMMMARMTKHV